MRKKSEDGKKGNLVSCLYVDKLMDHPQESHKVKEIGLQLYYIFFFYDNKVRQMITNALKILV